MIIIFFAFAQQADATIYYVSISGNDSANGTSIFTPWRTIARVNVQRYADGDKILFKSGEAFAGNLSIKTTNIFNANNVNLTIATYNGATATILAGKGAGIYVYNVSGLKISDLVIKGSWIAAMQKGNDAAGIDFYTDVPKAKKLKNISITRCEVCGFKNGGIVIGAWPRDKSQSGFDNVSITNCKIHDNGDCGISTYGYFPSLTDDTVYAHTNVYIGWNVCYNNLGIKDKGNNSGNGIVLGQTKGATIEHCVAYNNGWLNNYHYAGPVGIWCYDSKNIIIQYNEAHDNGTTAGTPDGDGFDFDGGVINSVMQYNYSHHNYGAGYLIYEFGVLRSNNKNNIIRYNISQDDSYGTSSYAGIYLKNKCDSNKIYNNTIYTSVSNALYVGNNYGINNYFVNNIFYCTKPGLYAAYINAVSCRFLNNAYYNGANPIKIFYNGITYTSVAAFRVTGQEIKDAINYGYDVNPQLANPGYGATIDNGNPSTLTNYFLNATSPLLNTGFNCTAIGWFPGLTDFTGNTLPQGGIFDGGACELKQTFAISETQFTSFTTQNEISFYPNPAKNNLYISSKQIIKSIKISNVSGATVLQQIVNNTNAEINIQGFTKGIYVAELFNMQGKRISLQKILKD